MRILFVTSTRIGDAVLSSGLLRHLIETHPGASVTVACGKPAAPLFEEVPGLARIIVMEKRPFAGHWLRLWQETVGTSWDEIMDLRGSPVTWAVPHRRRRAWRPVRTPEHTVVRFSRRMGLAEPAAPYLYIAPAHEAEAARLVPAGGPVLALGPTANWPGKEWPVERFAQLAQRLTGPGMPLHGARLLLTGAPWERPRATLLIAAFPEDRIVDLYGDHHLLTVYGCLKRARLYVGNDSGLMHLAAAAGTPTLGLFGPSPDFHYAPWGPDCAVVRTPEAFEELMPPGFDVNITHTLMGNLTVDTVEDAAKMLLARTETRQCG